MPLTDKQLAALAAGREKRRQSGGRKRLERIDTMIEDAGLDEPVREKTPKPKSSAAKIKPEQMVTPEGANLVASLLNWLVVRFFGEDAGFTQAEAVEIVQPLMCIGARRLVKLLERLAPQGTEGLKEGDPRDLGASGLAVVKYATRRVGEGMQRAEQRRQQRRQQRRYPDLDVVSPVADSVEATDDDQAEAPAARNGAAYAPSWVNIPRDMGQALAS